MIFSLSAEDRATLLATAREAISSRLASRRPEWPKAGAALMSPSGVFVTLHKEGALRGCIGRMSSPEPLIETVREMARAAAFEDPRFPSLDPEELEAIDLEITVLSPLRKIGDISEIDIGRHGIHIALGGRAGVLLPQVAVEQGWDRLTFVEQTCRKAGLPVGAWRDPLVDLRIFEGLVFGEKDEVPTPPLHGRNAS